VEVLRFNLLNNRVGGHPIKTATRKGFKMTRYYKLEEETTETIVEHLKSESWFECDDIFEDEDETEE